MANIAAQIGNFIHDSDSITERIAAVSDAGFSAVELLPWARIPAPDADFDEAPVVREVLDEFRVKPVSAHVPAIGKLEKDYENIINYLRQLGINDLIISFIGEEVSFSTRNSAAWAEFGKRIRVIARRCAGDGFNLGIHNHVLELLPVEGRLGLLRIFDEVEPEFLFWEADIGHIAAAHQRFGDLLRHLEGRCRFVHVKDVSGKVISSPVLEVGAQISNFRELTGPIGKRIEWETELGSGVIDLDEVVQLSLEHDVDWLISEIHKPDLDRQQAHDFLLQKLRG